MNRDQSQGVADSRLSDVADLNPEGIKGLAAESKIRYIDITSVSWEHGIVSDIPLISLSEAPSRAQRVVREGDVLVSNVRPGRRAFARVPLALDGEVASTGFTVLRAKKGVIAPAFLWGVVRSPELVSHLVGRESGSAYPAVRPSDVGDFVFPLPTMADQERIGAVLSAIDAKMDVNARAVVTAVELARSVIANAVAGFDRVPLRQVAAITRETFNPMLVGEEEVAHYSIPALDVDGLPEVTIASRIMSQKAILPARCVVVSRINPRIPRAWFVNHVGPEMPLASTEFAVLVPADGIGAEVLYAACTEPEFFEDLASKVTGTSSSHQRVQVEDVLDCLVLDISSVDAETARQCCDLVMLADRARKENRTLAAARDTALPELISGRMRVQDEAGLEAAS